jgi:enoyl-CoA hydratase
MMSAEHADEALRIGLLNTVLPTEGFLEHVLDWCTQITRNPAQAVFAAKRAVLDGFGLPLDDGLRLEARLFRDVNASPEARAANTAFPRPSGT